MQIRHTKLARDDLLGIWVEIARDNPPAADGIYDRLEARVSILAQFPEAGAARRNIDPAARILVEAPYLILYRRIPNGVQIVRVLHGARDIDAALFKEGVE